jgi:hypothetical protein
MKNGNKNLIRTRENRSTKLHYSGLEAGSLIDQSFSKLSNKQTQHLLSAAASEALRLEVKNREQNIDYHFGRKAVEDHIDAFNMLERKGATTRQSIKSDIKTGAGNVRIESKSGATCFVASVAYGDPNHPDVMFLRSFRDNVLLNTKRGMSFVGWYWKCGPRLASVINKIPFGKVLSKILIGGMVKGLKIIIYDYKHKS